MKLPRRTVLWTRPTDLSTECPTSPTTSPRIFLFHFPLLFPFFFLFFLYFLSPLPRTNLHRFEIAELPISSRNRRRSEDTDRGGGSEVLEGRRATWLRVRTSAGESKRVVLWTRPTDLSTRRSTPTLPLPARFSFHATLVSAFLPPCVCWRAASANS